MLDVWGARDDAPANPDGDPHQTRPRRATVALDKIRSRNSPSRRVKKKPPDSVASAGRGREMGDGVPGRRVPSAPESYPINPLGGITSPARQSVCTVRYTTLLTNGKNGGRTVEGEKTDKRCKLQSEVACSREYSKSGFDERDPWMLHGKHGLPGRRIHLG